MLYAISWFAVLSLVALWSLAAWAFHSVASWGFANAGAWVGASSGVETLRLPEGLAAWIPAELTAVFTGMGSAIAAAAQTLLDWAPGFSGWFSAAVWGVWALGSVLLIMLGIMLSGLIAAMRRRTSAGTGRPAAA